jgi:diacylglycerol kinase
MKNNQHYPLIKSIRFALSGIINVIKFERNIKIEIGIGFIAVILGLVIGITKTEWLAMILIISAILSAEAFNSAIESICNLLVDKLHLGYEETKAIRNIAAAAPLILSIASLIIGLVIFLPYFL